MSRRWSLIHNDATTTVLAVAAAIIVVVGWSKASNVIFQLGDSNSKDSQAQNSSNCQLIFIQMHQTEAVIPY
jgi:hypothetical protein